MDKFCSPYNFTTDWNAENHDGLPSYGWYLTSGRFTALRFIVDEGDPSG